MNAARALWSALHKEIGGVHEAAYLLALFTFGSQLLALVRDRIFAHLFGAGSTLDVFYAAFRIPDTLYALVASLVSVFVLIPFLEHAQSEGAPAVRAFLSRTYTLFSVVLVGLSIVAYIAAAPIIGVLYGSFSVAAQETLVQLMRILLVQPFLLGVSSLFAAYVQMRHRFVLYATAPILYNIGPIFGALVLYPYLGTQGLAWGVVIGAVLHLGVQTPFMIAEGMFPHLRMPVWCEVRRIIAVSVPRTIGLTMQQSVLLVFTALAATMAAGTLSTFTFAWNLSSVPLALIGASYSVAAFPVLARLAAQGERRVFADVLLAALRQVLLLGSLVTVGIVVLRVEFVRIVLQSGAFGVDAVRATSSLLAILALSLVAQAFVVLLTRACYAAGKTTVPIMINVTSALVAVVGACVLVMCIGESCGLAWVPTPIQSILSLGYAFVLSTIMNVALLLWYVSHSVVALDLRAVGRTMLDSGFAAVTAGLIMYGLQHVVMSYPLDAFLQGAFIGSVGVGVWFAVLLWIQNDDIGELKRVITRLCRRDAVHPGQGD